MWRRHRILLERKVIWIPMRTYGILRIEREKESKQIHGISQAFPEKGLGRLHRDWTDYVAFTVNLVLHDDGLKLSVWL